MNEENSVEVVSTVEALTPKSLRVDIDENFILLTFGNMENISESKKCFSALTSIRVSPKALYSLTSKLIETGFLYEKTYERSIGFSDVLRDSKE